MVRQRTSLGVVPGPNIKDHLQTTTGRGNPTDTSIGLGMG
jgi:hypothetical protein